MDDESPIVSTLCSGWLARTVYLRLTVEVFTDRLVMRPALSDGFPVAHHRITAIRPGASDESDTSVVIEHEDRRTPSPVQVFLADTDPVQPALDQLRTQLPTPAPVPAQVGTSRGEHPVATAECRGRIGSAEQVDSLTVDVFVNRVAVRTAAGEEHTVGDHDIRAIRFWTDRPSVEIEHDAPTVGSPVQLSMPFAHPLCQALDRLHPRPQEPAPPHRPVRWAGREFAMSLALTVLCLALVLYHPIALLFLTLSLPWLWHTTRNLTRQRRAK